MRIVHLELMIYTAVECLRAAAIISAPFNHNYTEGQMIFFTRFL